MKTGKYLSLTLIVGLLFLTLLKGNSILVQAARDLLSKDNASIYGPLGLTTTVFFPDNLPGNITLLEIIRITADIPPGVVDGDVTVQTLDGLSNPAPFVVGSSSTPDTSGIGTSWSTSFSGQITTDTIWSENILITGDVIITNSTTLTITPGVTVFFAANSDDQAAGRWTDKAELEIHSALVAEGTAETPVYFVSNAGNGLPGDWGGIVIRLGSTASSLRNCVVQDAQYGVYFDVNVDFATNGAKTGTISGNINNCSIQNNVRGINFHGRPDYPTGGTITLTPVIAGNLIANNLEEGISSQMHSGYGSIANYTVIQNNIIEANFTGIRTEANSWWLGSTTEYIEIINNTIRNNTLNGLYAEAAGSSDSSGSDTDTQPVIENNLFTNNNTHIHLWLSPLGADGAQILSPTIRYNTIGNATYGITIDDTEPYDTLTPNISYNIFYGFDNAGAYAVNNLTARNIIAEQNYWGATEDAWDAGAPAAIISGAVSVANHLDTTSPPILTRIEPGAAAAGASIVLHGANFDTAPTDLAITKSVTPALATPGTPITYTLAFTHTGVSIAAGVIITDIVPITITNPAFTSSGATITATAGITYAWSVQDLLPGAGGVITITGYVDPNLNSEPIIANTATISATTDVTLTNNAANASVEINIAPAVNAGADQTANEGDSVSFNGSFTDPGTDDTHTIEWDFGDGNSTTSTLNPTRVYPDDGVFTVTLTVTDSDGGSGTDTLVVTVNNVAPGVNAGSDQTTDEGGVVSFNGSFTDPGIDDNHTIEWDFGDSNSTTGTLTPTHTYIDNGVYAVTLTVTDNNGGENANTVTVTVNNVAPSVNSGPDQAIDEGEPISFSGSFTDPGIDDNHTIAWDFGDGASAAGTLNTTHTYIDNGLYYVTLTVTDNDGGMDADTLMVTVNNVPPTVNVGPDQTINEGDSVSFSGSFTDPGLDDSHTIEWDFGDGATATGALNPTHVYTNNGAYDVTLIVTDDDGGVGQASRQLLVVAEGNALTYLFLPVVANNFCTESSTPADIVLAIDTSLSMNGVTEPGGPTKLEAAQSAATQFLNLLTFPGDQAAIVTFDASAVLEHPLSNDRDSLIAALQSLDVEYSTRIDLALALAGSELTGPRHIQANSAVLILLTDGQPVGTDEATVLAEATMTKAQGITIYTIGLGADVNASLLQDVATSVAHYYEAPSTAELSAIYEQIANVIGCP